MPLKAKKYVGFLIVTTLLKMLLITTCCCFDHKFLAIKEGKNYVFEDIELNILCHPYFSCYNNVVMPLKAKKYAGDLTHPRLHYSWECYCCSSHVVHIHDSEVAIKINIKRGNWTPQSQEKYFRENSIHALVFELILWTLRGIMDHSNSCYYTTKVAYCTVVQVFRPMITLSYLLNLLHQQQKQRLMCMLQEYVQIGPEYTRCNW